MSKIQIGVVAKPQGLKGELKINPLTDDINRFSDIDYVYLNQNKYNITSVSIRGGFVVLKIENINSIDDAEKYRGATVSIDREDAVELSENEYFMVDLIGSKVMYEDGTFVGEIKNIDQFGGNFVVTCVDSSNREILFPFIQELLIKVDVDNKLVVVDAEKLEEVRVWKLIYWPYFPKVLNI